jgi:hypothetical protein
MSALANALSTGQVYWPSPSDKTDAAKICFCPCSWTPTRFRSYANKSRFKRAQLAGCCCKCSNVANLYSLPSACDDATPCSPGISALSVFPIGTTTATLTWTPAVGCSPATYTIFKNGVSHATVTGTSYVLTGLTAATSYTVAVSNSTDKPCEAVTFTTKS